jgi:hypothetical protein
MQDSTAVEPTAYESRIRLPPIFFAIALWNPEHEKRGPCSAHPTAPGAFSLSSRIVLRAGSQGLGSGAALRREGVEEGGTESDFVSQLA